MPKTCEKLSNYSYAIIMTSCFYDSYKNGYDFDRNPSPITVAHWIYS